MIKVSLPTYYVNEYDEVYQEMRQWCQTTLGRNPWRQSPIWKSYLNGQLVVDEVINRAIFIKYPVFFFAKKEHALLFVMRWK